MRSQNINSNFENENESDVASIKGRSNIHFQHTIMGALCCDSLKKITQKSFIGLFSHFFSVSSKFLFTLKRPNFSFHFPSIRFYFIFYLYINISVIHSILVAVVVWHASYYVICLKTNSLSLSLCVFPVVLNDTCLMEMFVFIFEFESVFLRNHSLSLARAYRLRQMLRACIFCVRV